jgi:hypothetical protein
MESEGTMDQWYFATTRSYTVFARAYAPCEEKQRAFRQVGETLVARMQAGVLRPHTIIRIDYHVSTDALCRPLRKIDASLSTLTVWLIFEDVVKAAAMWLGLRIGGALQLLTKLKTRYTAALGLFEPQIVTSTVVQTQAFWAAREARPHDIIMLKAMGIPLASASMDDSTRARLWVPDLIQAADAEAQAAAKAKLARAADTLERESADPDDREYWRLFREALERDNNPRCNA